jgi:hypothetical protein
VPELGEARQGPGIEPVALVGQIDDDVLLDHRGWGSCHSFVRGHGSNGTPQADAVRKSEQAFN